MLQHVSFKMAGYKDLDIPDTGAVFTFGHSRFADNVASHFYIRNDPVVELACGDEHTAVICQKGRVFVFGNNDYGQLGLGHRNIVVKPSCVKSLKPERVVHVACGRAHTIISTDSGKMFAWGSNSDGQLGVGDTKDRLEPVEVLGVPDSIVQLSAGCLSSAALTANGEVYMWGSNSDGQLGLADTAENILQPVFLPFDQHVVYISCGYYHTAFITGSGILYTCGESETGKLGLPNSVINVTSPQKVPMAAPVKSVACGGNHTVALTENGEVFAFGSNFNGQLGLGKETTQSVLPMRVTTLEKHVVISAACGESHTAFITKNGKLFTCGEGRHGKLCNELDFSNSRTTPVHITRFQGFAVWKAACGGCHTIVLACRKDDCDSDINNLENISIPTQKLLPPLQRVPVITSVVKKFDEDTGDDDDLHKKNEVNNSEAQENEATQNGSTRQGNDHESTKKDNNNENGDFDKLSEKSERSSNRSAGLSERSHDLCLKIDDNEDVESLSNKSCFQERDQSSQATGIIENSKPEEDIRETRDTKDSVKNVSNGSEEEDNGNVKTEIAEAQGPVARFFSNFRSKSGKPSPAINTLQQKTNSAQKSAEAQLSKKKGEEGEGSNIISDKWKGCQSENKSKTCTLL